MIVKMWANDGENGWVKVPDIMNRGLLLDLELNACCQDSAFLKFIVDA